MKTKNVLIYVIICSFICVFLTNCTSTGKQGISIEYIDEPILLESNDLSKDCYKISYKINNLNLDEIEYIILKYDLSSNRYDVGMKKTLLKIDTSDLHGVKNGKLDIIIDENGELQANLDLGDLKSFGYIELPYVHKNLTFKMLQDGSNISLDEGINVLQIDYTRTLELSYSNNKNNSVDINDTEKLFLLLTKKASK